MFLHWACQSEAQRRACQRRSSLDRQAATLWPGVSYVRTFKKGVRIQIEMLATSCARNPCQGYSNRSEPTPNERWKTLIFMVTSWPGRAFTPSLQSPPRGALTLAMVGWFQHNSQYDSFSDVGESWVWFASKNLTPCRMHWNAFLIAQIIAKCHSFPNMYDML